jgi:hypothetical protein
LHSTANELCNRDPFVTGEYQMVQDQFEFTARDAALHACAVVALDERNFLVTHASVFKRAKELLQLRRDRR